MGKVAAHVQMDVIHHENPAEQRAALLDALAALRGKTADQPIDVDSEPTAE